MKSKRNRKKPSTRVVHEKRLDGILNNINTLTGLKICISKSDSEIHVLTQKIKELHSDEQRAKHFLRKEMKFWYLFRNRIYLTSEMWVNDALDEQAYQMMPEYERTSITKYRYLARFQLKAIELNRIVGYDRLVKCGWYSPSNPNGVVKDHRISIKFGFENKIDPAILSHPCNCEFLTFKDNGSKSDSCSIGLITLQESIENWKKDNASSQGS